MGKMVNSTLNWLMTTIRDVNKAKLQSWPQFGNAVAFPYDVAVLLNNFAQLS